MSKNELIAASAHDAEHGTFRLYISGFVSSIVLTLAAYLLVVHHTFASRLLIGTIVVLALIQFLVQMFFFLHLGRESKPRWKLLVLGFMIMVVLILVIGSLWIMANLNYRMTPQQINTYMQNQDGAI